MGDVTDIEGRVRELMALAGRAWADGRPQELQRILQQVEAEAPEHPVALNEAAQRRLGVGDLLGARAILEKAIKIDGSVAILWANLAGALQGLKLPDQEEAAIEKALTLDARNTPLLLRAAALHENRGDVRGAAAIYRRALENASRPPDLPPAMRAQLQHARTVVEANKLALENYLEDRLRDVRARHRDQPLRRFEKCMATVLRKQPIYRQQPSFMYFPEVPAIEFFDRDLFPWLDPIEAASADIRAEFIKVLAEDSANLEPYVQGATQPNDSWSELAGSRRWSVYYLWRTGLACPENLARCPKTAEALKHWPQCDLRGSAPSAVFSILDAKTLIPAHTGVNNARLIVHLPLIVPPDCWFRVGSEKREWEPGKALIFDDTIEHEAWNGSDVPRTVLIFDIWNPYLSETEREMVSALTDGVGAFYGTLPAYV